MVAALQEEPRPHARRIWIEDPLTFVVRLSRQQWRDVRFARLRDPLAWPGEPRLVFENPLSDELAKRLRDFSFAMEDVQHITKTTPIETRVHLQNRLRRCHVALVNLAIGYTWPRNPPGYIEFADE